MRKSILAILALTVVSLAVAAAASAASTTSAAATATHAACTDRGFRRQARISISQASNALDWFAMDAYTSAEAWALRSWRTMRATAPCWASYRRFRQYELKASAAVWNAVRFAHRGDHTTAASLLGQAQRWNDHAAAEQATWP
jgi:hypothetical protein